MNQNFNNQGSLPAWLFEVVDAYHGIRSPRQCAVKFG